MMYPYITFDDGTEVVHSGIIHGADDDKVVVHFERATANGFDSARCELPSYTWIDWEGQGAFSAQEKARFEEFLRNNAHLLFRYARNGGAQVA